MQWPNPKIFNWSIILFFKILKQEKQVHVQTFWQTLNNLLKILRSFVKHQIFIDCIFDFPLVCPIFVFFLRIRVHFLLGFPVNKWKERIEKWLKTKNQNKKLHFTYYWWISVIYKDFTWFTHGNYTLRLPWITRWDSIWIWHWIVYLPCMYCTWKFPLI